MNEKKQSILLIESTFILSFLFLLFYGVGTLLVYSEFSNQRYFDVWSKIMMPPTGFPIVFFISALIYSIIFSFIISFTYRLVKKSFTTKSQILSGIMFGAVLFFIIFVPLYSHIFLIFNIPFLIISVWLSAGLLFSIVSGIMLSLVNN